MKLNLEMFLTKTVGISKQIKNTPTDQMCTYLPKTSKMKLYQADVMKVG